MIDCPLCGREMAITPHQPYQLWTPQQIWVVRRLRDLGIPQKVVARLVTDGHGLSERSVQWLEYRARRRGQAVRQ